MTSRFLTAALTATSLALCLPACTVGPDFKAPTPAAPDDWASWRGGDPSLIAPTSGSVTIPADWWTILGDPVLDRLERQAMAASPDIETAALHFAQARAQRGIAASASLPQVNASAQVNRQRMSEYGASTRLFDAIGGSASGASRDELAKFLADPFTLYQGGFDAGWEIDLWGRVRRSIESADAQVAGQGAMLDLARLSVASEVAQAYFALRTAQAQIALAKEDIALLTDQVSLVAARADGGMENHTGLETDRAGLRALEASLPALQAQEAAQIGRIALALGQQPGSLRDLLLPTRNATVIPAPPDLSLGLPSEVAQRRPDVRAAESKLHAATAEIGIAIADLYPAIRLGGGFGLESYRKDNLFDWASRTWQIGPGLSLPIFDGGRRRAAVQVRKLEAREAFMNYQTIVLKAWQEIDDALNDYTAEWHRREKFIAREGSARAAWQNVEARYRAGSANYLPVIDARRAVLQADRDVADSEGRLRTHFAAVNKAIGNAPSAPGTPPKD
ncbi:efflux transporter outer membrane subunit [Novosphingobium sp. ST904]|uniref:efflux transporter outer membrane subunit n=1 Tax=Novosphingobium sp. ST904 TaxID=1684385 RepID=UPI0006C88CA4|nr:efflux transporter outer membrane subunit [Novosphingobium sp. ST904]KPH63059.1 RND transporter [Novosphingobium sp. ST904]TCM32524.1 NodT family efflux transporter outer membrane factor (OMF) lipoprotein [Novosphingobium sp. ST904]